MHEKPCQRMVAISTNVDTRTTDESSALFLPSPQRINCGGHFEFAILEDLGYLLANKFLVIFLLFRSFFFLKQ